jgi:methionyl-tRNA formyltransferase
MDVGMDTGDIILQKELAIAPEETGGSLFDKLAVLGGELINEALLKIENKTAERIPQEHEKATYVKVISKEMGKIDFTQPAVKIERLIRGLNPWPSAFTTLDGKTLKLWKADLEEADAALQFYTDAAEESKSAEPGEIIRVSKDSFTVKTGDGILVIRELQLEGKKRMAADAFLRGFPLKAGRKLV